MDFIIDRKKKRYKYGMDEQWNDPLGIEQAQKNKARTIEFYKNSDNLIDKFVCNGIGTDAKSLIGKKIWAIKSDNSRIFEGYIVGVHPSRHIIIKVNGENIPIRFQDVISMET